MQKGDRIGLPVNEKQVYRLGKITAIYLNPYGQGTAHVKFDDGGEENHLLVGLRPEHLIPEHLKGRTQLVERMIQIGLENIAARSPDFQAKPKPPLGKIRNLDAEEQQP